MPINTAPDVTDADVSDALEGRDELMHAFVLTPQSMGNKGSNNKQLRSSNFTLLSPTIPRDSSTGLPVPVAGVTIKVETASHQNAIRLSKISMDVRDIMALMYSFRVTIDFATVEAGNGNGNGKPAVRFQVGGPPSRVFMVRTLMNLGVALTDVFMRLDTTRVRDALGQALNLLTYAAIHPENIHDGLIVRRFDDFHGNGNMTSNAVRTHLGAVSEVRATLKRAVNRYRASQTHAKREARAVWVKAREADDLVAERAERRATIGARSETYTHATHPGDGRLFLTRLGNEGLNIQELWRTRDPYASALARSGAGVLPAEVKTNNLAFLAFLGLAIPRGQLVSNNNGTTTGFLAKLSSLLREYDPDGVLIALADPLDERLMMALRKLLADESASRILTSKARAAVQKKLAEVPAMTAFANASKAYLAGQPGLSHYIRGYTTGKARVQVPAHAGLHAPSELTIFRGIVPNTCEHTGAFNGKNGRNSLTKTPGCTRNAGDPDTLIHKQFLASSFFPTSTDPIISLGFTDADEQYSWLSGPPVCCLTKLALPTTARALYINSVSGFQEQHEVIVLDNSYTSTLKQPRPVLYWGMRRVHMETGRVVPDIPSTDTRKRKR
jgi:hypothetical protein